MTPYHYWLDNDVKIFSHQFNFLRSPIYDLKTDEDDLSFVPSSQKATHHNTYITFLKHQKPKNYIFVNYKYTSPYTVTHLYTIDHSRITGYLRNYDPIKQYFCLLPYNDTSRPIIVPQEYLIHFDDFLLPCNVPLSYQNPSLLLNILFLHLSPTKGNLIIQHYRNNHTHITNYCSSLQTSSPSWLRQKKPNLRHNTLLLNNTLQNYQQLLLTN